MSLWGRVFAAVYDRMLAGAEDAGLRQRRHDLLAKARGRVLEIGAGTGLNLAHYPDAVEEIVFTEPEEPMARRLTRKLTETGRRGEVIAAPAERLPFEDDSFDTVVCTLVLCTVTDPRRALSEIARVLRPGGQFLFLEHVRADDPKLARWQDRLARPWRLVRQRLQLQPADTGADRETLRSRSRRSSAASSRRAPRSSGRSRSGAPAPLERVADGLGLVHLLRRS